MFRARTRVCIGALLGSLGWLASSAYAQPVVNTVPRVGPECPLVFAADFVDVATQLDVIVTSSFDPELPSPLPGVEQDVSQDQRLPVYSAVISPPECQAVLEPTDEVATMSVVSLTSEAGWPVRPQGVVWPSGVLAAGILGLDSFGILADFEIVSGAACIDEPVVIRIARDSECSIPPIYHPGAEDSSRGGCHVAARSSMPVSWACLLLVLVTRRKVKRRL